MLQSAHLAAVAVLTAALSAQSPLTTTFANNNAGSVGGAVFFDLQVNVGVTISSLDVNLGTAANTSGSIGVYTTPTSHIGNEANMAVWTLVGSGPAISMGAGQPTPVALAAPIILAPGNYGVAFVGVGHSHAYTNGNGFNQTYRTNELTLTAGAAMNVAFSGGVFTPRIVNTSIRYSVTPGYATAAPYGLGCNARTVSFYESFPAGACDLGSASGTNVVQMIPTGTGYIVNQGAANWFTPTSAPLAILDDALSASLSLPFSFPYPGGSTNSIIIESNGNVWLQPPTHASLICDTSPAALLNRGPVLSAFYDDLDPSTAGGGSVSFDVDPNSQAVYCTWDSVPIYIAAPPTPRPTNTFQVALFSSGMVELRYRQLDSTGSWTSTLVGFSPGTGNRDGGARDISASMPFITAPDLAPLGLAAIGRPILGNAGFGMSITDIPASSPIGALLLGFTQFNPGIPLAVVGMPGCSQYTSVDGKVITPFLGTPTAVNFGIPNLPVLTGLHAYSQALAFDPAANALGLLVSNGVDLKIDVQ